MSKIPVKKKNEIVRDLETLYTEKESFDTLSLYDPDYTKKQGIRYFVHEKIISKFRSFGMKLKELKEESFHQPFLEYDMEDILKKQKKSIKSVEKGYFLFSLIYPYYLAKFGFDLQNSKNICVGPYIVRDKKKKKEIKIDSNYNESAMLSFAIETGSHKNEEEEEKEDEKPKDETQTGGGFDFSKMKKKAEEKAKELKEKAKTSDTLKDIRSRGKEVKEKAKEAKDKATSSDMFGDMKEKAKAKAEEVKAKAEEVKEKAQEKSEGLKEKAKEFKKSAEEKAEKVLQEAQDKMNEATNAMDIEKLKSEAEQKAQSLLNKAEEKSQSLLEKAKDAKNSVSDKMEEMKEKAKDAKNSVSDKIEEMKEKKPKKEKKKTSSSKMDSPMIPGLFTLDQLRSLTEDLGRKNNENNNSNNNSPNQDDLIKQQIQLKIKELENNAFMQKKEYEKTIKELKLKIYKTQDDDDEEVGSLLDNLAEQIREMDKKLSQSEEMKKLAQGIKKLYTIFTFYSFKQIKKNKKYKQLIFGFLRADHDTRVKIIQGTMSNQPVYETLRNYFKDSKKKPSSPLKFHYFFGLSDIGKISAFMKSLKLQNNTNNESVLNATNNEAKNIVQEPVIEAEVVSKGGSKNKTIRKIILEKRTPTKKNVFRRILKRKLNKYKKKKQFTQKINSGYRWIKSRKIKTK